ncbi:hypothetical protein [Geminocystis sp. NIES-3709]|uniref:hypothetical protein n=1 Tax=Geminocystis sp. NIES-3709 TaxID=1617448 RepID=UPI000825052A|nr:hypothetical protein [Geminocystis sp. NIES-3709]
MDNPTPLTAEQKLEMLRRCGFSLRSLRLRRTMLYYLEIEYEQLEDNCNTTTIILNRLQEDQKNMTESAVKARMVLICQEFNNFLNSRPNGRHILEYLGGKINRRKLTIAIDDFLKAELEL